MSKTTIALTIAGSDSGGGAGIQADLKTFSALGVYGASVITALTAQNTRGVFGIHDVPPGFVTAQINAVLDDLAVDAIKIGMLSVPATIEAVAAGLARFPGPVVLDPVMVAASGDALLTSEAISTLITRLLPRADVLTPNLPEAAALLNTNIALDEAEMAAQGRTILTFGCKAVLMKGGHGAGAESVDLLITPENITRFAAPRIAGRNSHGTGCTLSSAITAGLAKGMALEKAVGEAKTYISAAINAADRLAIGHGHNHGHGPTHHFHAWW
jgi:hydroxymethylpyrimidine/phosphomethylpyrimidine kinase